MIPDSQAQPTRTPTQNTMTDRRDKLTVLVVGGLDELRMLGLIAPGKVTLTKEGRTLYDEVRQSKLRPWGFELHRIFEQLEVPRELYGALRLLLDDVWIGKTITWRMKELMNAD